MKTTIDLLVRIVVEHPDGTDPLEVVNNSELYFHGPLDPQVGKIVSDEIKEIKIVDN